MDDGKSYSLSDISPGEKKPSELKHKENDRLMMTEPRTLVSEYVMDQIEEVKESEDEGGIVNNRINPSKKILNYSGMPSSIGFVKTPDGQKKISSPEAFVGYA